MTAIEHVHSVLAIINSRHHAGRGLELVLIEMLAPLTVHERYGYYHVYYRNNLLGRIHYDRNLEQAVFNAA